MTELFSNEEELGKALEILQIFIKNISNNELKALEIYYKIKTKQRQY